MKILGIITARAESKRIIKKNFRKINGKSITEIVVEQMIMAKEEGYISDVYLSTDSNKLMSECKKYDILNVPLRSKELSGDNVKSVDVIIGALQEQKEKGNEYDAIVLLQPTAPLTIVEDIKSIVDILKTHKYESVVSACELNNIYKQALYEKIDDLFIPISDEHNRGKRSQDCNTLYLRNGALYATWTDYILNNKRIISSRPGIYVMPTYRSCDINTIDDLRKARKQYNKNKKEMNITKIYNKSSM